MTGEVRFITNLFIANPYFFFNNYCHNFTVVIILVVTHLLVLTKKKVQKQIKIYLRIFLRQISYKQNVLITIIFILENVNFDIIILLGTTTLYAFVQIAQIFETLKMFPFNATFSEFHSYYVTLCIRRFFSSMFKKVSMCYGTIGLYIIFMIEDFKNCKEIYTLYLTP